MYLHFIDDENLVGCQCCYGRPEDRYGSCDDGEVDFEDGEDVHYGGMERHVKNGFGTRFVDRHGDHATDSHDDHASVLLVRFRSEGTLSTYTQPKLNKPTKPARLLPAILNVVTKGTGRRRTKISSKQLLTACPKNM